MSHKNIEITQNYFGLILNLKNFLTLVAWTKGRLFYFLLAFYQAEIDWWLGPDGKL